MQPSIILHTEAHQPIGLTRLLEEGWVLTPVLVPESQRAAAITNARSSPDFHPARILLSGEQDIPEYLRGKVRFVTPKMETGDSGRTRHPGSESPR
jgi:hypothetical protein